MYNVFFVFVVTLLLKSCTEAYNYGDIRLFLNGSSSLNNSQGVIEIFINEKWGTVCIPQFNIASAAAACRQLGFVNALDFNLPREYNFQIPPNILPVITDVSCNDKDSNDLSTTGYLHILRCVNKIFQENDTCASNNSIAAVKCDTGKLTDDPYNGQVRLVNGSSPSSGIAQIYLHNEWGNICSDGMSNASASSFCRQIGYTNSSNYTSIDSDIDVPVWIDSTDCSQSRECFSTECIKYPKSMISTGPCANNSRDTMINCIFTATDDGLLSSGSIFECAIHSSSVVGLAVGLSVGFFFILCLIIVGGILLACFTISTCPLYAYRIKKKYTGLI